MGDQQDRLARAAAAQARDSQFFGGSQPNLPARSVVGVAALANPGFLVEIEVIAVKDAK